MFFLLQFLTIISPPKNVTNIGVTKKNFIRLEKVWNPEKLPSKKENKTPLVHLSLLFEV